MKLTVSEYARQHGVSVQTIYKRIKKGVITSFKQDGKTYINISGTEPQGSGSSHIKDDSKQVKQSSNSELNEVLKMVKTLQKEIKRLTRKLEKCNQTKEDTLLAYIQEVKQLRLSAPEEEIIEVDDRKKKKKEKKRKKSKH